MQKYNTIYEINTLFDHNLTLLKVHLKIESFYSKKPVVLTIGTFDGVHAGHRAVIDVLKAKANKINGETALLTFSPHPRVVLHPDNHNLRLLNTRKEKEALLENAAYDEDGQLLSGSYMDYTMPRADNFPEFNLGFTCTHATSNPLGVKGCGEAGAIASPPTVMNAVIDALGGQEISMPATAEKVWKACKTMKKSNAKAA